MANKDITLQQLKEQKKELNEKLEHYEFNGPSEKVQKLEDELFEINDTIKKIKSCFRNVNRNGGCSVLLNLNNCSSSLYRYLFFANKTVKIIILLRTSMFCE